MPNLRDAVIADAATIADFNCRLAWETEHKRLDPATIAAGVTAVLERPELGRYFVAEDDKKGMIIGQLMITYEWSDWRNGQFWWIQSVFVRVDWRGCGVFRRLYEHVTSLARATPGVCGLRLYVDHANSRAQVVYEDLGMENVGYLFYETDWSSK
ncbi:MAG: GNAT family N-acetyltransferase [Pirellulales bacterium]